MKKILLASFFLSISLVVSVNVFNINFNVTSLLDWLNNGPNLTIKWKRADLETGKYVGEVEIQNNGGRDPINSQTDVYQVDEFNGRLTACAIRERYPNRLTNENASVGFTFTWRPENRIPKWIVIINQFEDSGLHSKLRTVLTKEHVFPLKGTLSSDANKPEEGDPAVRSQILEATKMGSDCLPIAGR